MQDLLLQRHALEDMLSMVQRLIERIEEFIQSYRLKENTLAEVGLPVQIAREYHAGFAVEKVYQLHNLVEAIKLYEIPYIKKQIEVIDNAIASAGGGGAYNVEPKTKAEIFASATSKVKELEAAKILAAKKADDGTPQNERIRQQIINQMINQNQK